MMGAMDVSQQDYTAARMQLHTVAEWLMAGPQHATSGTIRLEAGNGGIATVADPALSVTAAGFTCGDRTLPLRGTVSELAAAAGLPGERPDVEYHDPVPGDLQTALSASPAAFDAVLRVFDFAADVMDEFSSETATLWPEHFDLGLRDHDVNYGVSPGDAGQAQPYAYVGPDQVDDNPFWNTSFGAALVIDPDDPGCAAKTLAFFEQGRDAARR